MGHFERDTAVEPGGELAFDCRIESDWWVVAGPNGGYVAAILTRALTSVEGERPLRSLTVQYLRAPKEGPARVEVARERVGRTVSFPLGTPSAGGSPGSPGDGRARRRS